MNVLIIVASPQKKGNSAQIADKIISQLSSAKNLNTEVIFLANLDFGRCVGCHACINRGEEKCPCREARDIILEKIECSDGIVFITPIYCMQITYLLKTLFDRLAFLWHRPRFFGKKVMAITVGGGAGPVAKPVINYIKLNVLRWGMEFVSSASLLRLDSSVTPKAQLRQKKLLSSAVEKFSKSLKTGKKKPTLSDLIWFNIWRDSAIIDKTGTQLDFKYWHEKGWFNHGVNYYYPVPTNILKLATSRFFRWATRLFMKNIYVPYDEIAELEQECQK